MYRGQGPIQRTSAGKSRHGEEETELESAAAELKPGERKVISAMHVLNSNAAIKLFDDPAALMSPRRGSNLIQYMLNHATKDTVVISFSRAAAASAFNRIIKLRRGKIVFDGSPQQWLKRKEEKESIELPPNAN